MKPDRIQAGHVAAASFRPFKTAVVAVGVVLAAGCAAPPPVREIVMVQVPVTPPPAEPAAVIAPAPPPASKAVLDYAEQLASLPATDLPREIGRLNEAGDSPVRNLQLAMALVMTGLPSDLVRAQSLASRVAENPASDTSLRPLARILAAQYWSQRRAEELIDRQAQQIRDTQRRVDQLSDRLEAMRAIERSLPARRPGAAVSAGELRSPTP
ncbi:MAG: hypothetical protein EOO28_34400 [Comamonadaceae bacterium]|nr:MAG: hypothetical protein EOO28_34400 [Comamonadaceae bacterium]